MTAPCPSLADDVAEALAERARRTSFRPVLEAQYEADTGARQCRSAVRSALIGLTLYAAYVINDFLLLPDLGGMPVLVRLGIVSPVALIGVWILTRNPDAWLRDTITASFTIMVTASVLYLMLMSQAPLRGYQADGVFLVLVYQTMMQRVRFPFAIAAVAISILLYAGAIIMVPELPQTIRLSKMLVVAGGGCFMLIASYRMERQDRRFYLLALSDLIKNRELDTMSKTDPLTGLGNRRRLEEVIETVTADGECQERPTAVLLIDIDKFKLFNDHYGHPAGDACLADVARLAAAQLRSPDDLAVRYGGEEFIFLLQGCDEAEAVATAERMRIAIEMARIPHDPNAGGAVTISIGVASACFGPGLGPTELVAAADAALYLAKQSGRNRVVSGLNAVTSKVPIIDRLAV